MLFLPSSFAHGLGELADLLGKPCDGRRNPAGPITLPIGLLHHHLEFIERHACSSRHTEA